MSTSSRSWIRGSVPMLVALVALTACTGSVSIGASSTTSVSTTTQASGTTSTTSIPDDEEDDFFDSDEDDADADDGAPTGVWMKLDDQTFDFEPTKCEVDDGNVTVVGPGTERTSGDDVYLDMQIAKPENFSEGTVTVILGARVPGGAGDKLVATIGDGGEYTVTTFDETAEIEVAFDDAAGKSAGTGEFSITCD